MKLDKQKAHRRGGQEQYKDLSKQGYYNVGPDDCDCVNTGDLVTKFCKSWGDNLNWTSIWIRS